MKFPRSWIHAGAAALLSVGAPLGWLFIRAATGSASEALEELRENRLLYGYLALSTGLAFTGYGWVVGRLNERLARTNTELLSRATLDPLTGLKNPKVFHEELRAAHARAQRSGSPLSLLVLDVDLFKEVNDRFGHAIGDQVLCKLASVINASMRKGDIACRIGGEEFALICPGASCEEAVVIAERLRRAIEADQLAALAGRRTVTVSVGVAEAGRRSPLELFDAADASMYRAKQAGRNRVARAA